MPQTSNTPNEAIGIMFKVYGNGSIVGNSSGALIKRQLKEIVAQINAKPFGIKIQVDKSYFAKQLSGIKKEIEKQLGTLPLQINPTANTKNSGGNSNGGNSAGSKAADAQVEKTLERIYALRLKIYKLQSKGEGDSIASVQTRNQLKQLEESVQKGYQGLSDEQKASLESYNSQLDIALKSEEERLGVARQLTEELKAQKAFANGMERAKLSDRMESLYTQNADVLARSPEAKGLVDDLKRDVTAALGKRDQLPKDELRALSQRIVEVSAKVKECGTQTDTLGNKFKETFASKALQRIANIALMFIAQALRQVYTNVKEIDDAMTQLKIVTRDSAKAYRDFADDIAKSAQEIGASITDLINSTTVYARLGYSLKEAATLAKATTIYSNVASTSVGDATTNITAIIKAFGIEASSVEDVLDQLVYVGNHFAISSAEIGEGMNNAASALAANGNTLQEAIGILTAANVTVQNVSKSSTGVRTIAARISRSLTELDELGEDVGDVYSTAKLDSEMRALGVAITTANGELRSTYDILADLSERWEEYTDTERAAIAEMLAGTRQQNVFYSIMQNWGDATRVVKDASLATGTLQKSQEIYLDSIEGKSQRLKATWEQFSQDLLDSAIVKFFVDLLDWIGGVLDGIISLGDGAVSKIGLIAAALAGLMAMLTKLTPRIATLIENFRAIRDMATQLGGKGAALKGWILDIGLALKDFMAKNGPLLIITTIITLMTTLEGKVKGSVELIVGFITLLTVVVVAAIKTIDGAIKNFLETNIVGWVLVVLTAVVAMIKGIADLIKECNPSFDELKDRAKEAKEAWEEAGKAIEETKDKLEEVAKQIDELNAKDSLTFIDEQQLAALKQEEAQLKMLREIQEATAKQYQKSSVAATRDAMDVLNGKVKNGQRDNPGWAAVVGFFTLGIGNAIWAGADAAKETLSEATDRILSDWENATDEERNQVLEYMQQQEELLQGYEYQMPEVDADGNIKELEDWQKAVNQMLDESYGAQEKYAVATGNYAAAWEAVFSRLQYQTAITKLTDLANSFKNTALITGETIQNLYDEDGEIKGFLEHLKDVGLWDGTNMEQIATVVRSLRTGMEQIPQLSLADDIEQMTDKFEALSNALEEVNSTGVMTLDTLAKLAKDYPTLLRTYFINTNDGYMLRDEYKNVSSYDILEGMAVDSVKEYAKQLKEQQDILAGLKPEDDDYATALRNVAIAQDNLNNKTLEWASLLREAKIAEEKERLEEEKERLEEQLDLYKSLVDIRKDLLETYEEETKHQKELAKKQMNVSNLRTQLSLLRMDNSAEGQARARELEAQLKEAQEELDEYVLEDAVSDIVQSLDDQYAEYESFINSEVDRISAQIEELAKTIRDVLQEALNGDSNGEEFTLPGQTTNASATEINDLYRALHDKPINADNPDADGNVQKFMSAAAAGNSVEADQYYNDAKEFLNNYKEQKPTGSGGDGVDWSGVSVKRGSSWALGQRVTINFGGKDFSARLARYATSKEIRNGLSNMPDMSAGVHDGRLFIHEKGGSTVDYFAMDPSNKNPQDYGLLVDLLKTHGHIYHTGGFVGDITSLRSNEEFAKLLKGEHVSTPAQMDTFMRKTLPKLIGYTPNGGGTINNNAPLVEIRCGEVSPETMPQLRRLVDDAADEVYRRMEDALGRTGYKKKY